MTDFETITPLPADPRPGTKALAETALGALGIELLRVDEHGVDARMPAPTTRAGMATLLVLAESAASTAAGFAVGPGRRAFGAELNASMLAVPAPGMVVARARPLQLGPAQHVWGIQVFDRDGVQALESRCTLGIVDA